MIWKLIRGEFRLSNWHNQKWEYTDGKSVVFLFFMEQAVHIFDGIKDEIVQN